MHLATSAPRVDAAASHQAGLDAAAAMGLVILWSSGFVGARLGADHAGPDTLLSWRLMVSAGVLLTWWAIRARRRERPLPRRALGQHAVVGLFSQAMYLGGVFGGVAAGVPAGTTALIAALQPLVVANASSRVLGERVSIRQRAGLWIGIIGVAVVVADDLSMARTPFWAYLLPLGAMLALSAGTILDRRWLPEGGIRQSFTVHTVAAAIVVAGGTALFGDLTPPATAGFWLAIAWVTVLAGFGGYGMYLFVVRRNGATHASVLLYLTPPTTLLWAWLMFGDGIGGRGLTGFAVCAAAVYLAIPRQTRR